MVLKVSIGRFVSEFAAMMFMGVFSFGLLAYVGYGEASLKYPQFEVLKVASQARLIHSNLERYLSAGFPLRQFVGFETLAAPIVKVDPAIDGMTVLTRQNAIVFESGHRGIDLPVLPEIDNSSTTISIQASATHMYVFMPLRSRFGFGGQLVIHVPKVYLKGQIYRATWFFPLAATLGALSVGAFGAFGANKSREWRTRWDKIAFIVAFAGVASAVVVGLAGLYSDGVQSKALALGGALTERVSAIYDLGLSLQDIDGLDRLFSEYQASSPELKTVAMIVDDVVLMHTDPRAIGSSFVPDGNAIGVLTEVDEIPGLNVKVYVSIPFDIVYSAVARSAKTLAVLLVASGFMAGLFFQLGGAVQRMRQANAAKSTDGASSLETIKPVLFMGFLVENLAVSFLPQLMQKSASASALPSFMTSAMFMAYFVTFALSLVPAGIYATKRPPRELVLAGALCVAVAASLIAFSDYYLTIVLSRLLAGLGQGLLFIGCQSLILAYAAADKRTQSAGIIVYTFNGGMLSGMVIGGMLVGYVGASGVFWLGAAIAVCIAAYTLFLTSPTAMPPSRQGDVARPRGSILGVFKSRGFVWTTILVGIPAKAVLTGVIVFAMPLVLSGMRLEQEDIGQVIMFYALGVLLSSHYVSRYADRVGNIRTILIVGLALSGVGLAMIGSVDWPFLGLDALGPVVLTLALLFGTFTVGVAHGCINAPVITHIASTSAARELGEAPVTAFYRFIERFGHVAGPLAVGQLLIFGNGSPVVLSWIGFIMIGFAALYWVLGGGAADRSYLDASKS